MPLKIVRGKTLPIGVDLGSHSVKMAQLRWTEDSLELIAAGSAKVPRTDSRNLQERLANASLAIHEIMRSRSFKGRECILSMPADSTFVYHVRVPKMPPAETRAALQWELQGKLPFPADDAIIRHVVAGDVPGDGEIKQEVVVVASARSVVDAYLRMAGRAGLDVSCVNIEACAVVECFSRLFRRACDAARTILYVDLGTATTQAVLSHGNRIVFARNLAMGADQFDQAVASGLKIPLDQAQALRSGPRRGPQDAAVEDELYHLLDRPLAALADELTQCLRYYESVFRNQNVERAIFVGGQAYDKRLCQALAQKLNLPAQIGDPLIRIQRVEGAGLDIGLDRREPQPDWAVAVGLSIGAAEAA